MWKRFLFVLLPAALLQFPAMADAGVRIGIGLGFGIPIGPYYGPYYGGYPYYAPYAYPPPVVIQQPPVVMPAPTYYQQAPSTFQQAATAVPQNVVGSAPSYSTAPPPVANPPAPQAYNPVQAPGSVVLSNYDHSAADALLQKLSQPDENVRRDAVMDLGRMKAERAVDTLVSVLANDASPVVRDAAARALGLIGSTRCLPPLIRAAQVDNDRDVRHSAQFAIEVIRSQMRR